MENTPNDEVLIDICTYNAKLVKECLENNGIRVLNDQHRYEIDKKVCAHAAYLVCAIENQIGLTASGGGTATAVQNNVTEALRLLSEARVHLEDAGGISIGNIYT